MPDKPSGTWVDAALYNEAVTTTGTLIQQVNHLKEEIDGLKDQLVIAAADMSRLEKENERLKNQIVIAAATIINKEEVLKSVGL